MTTYNIDTAHSEIAFTVKHMMVSKVRGSFNDFEGWIKTNKEDMEGSEVYFKADVASIDTRAPQRDEHLRGPEFFDIATYPELTFKSNSFKRINGDNYEMTGQLTMHGITNEITLSVEYTGEGVNATGNPFLAFEINGAISRKEYGITWNPAIEGGGVIVSDEVKLDLTVQVANEEV